MSSRAVAAGAAIVINRAFASTADDDAPLYPGPSSLETIGKVTVYHSSRRTCDEDQANLSYRIALQ
jgi:hypothetical protein